MCLMWPFYGRVYACGFACCAAAGGRCLHCTICQLPNCRCASVCIWCVCACAGRWLPADAGRLASTLRDLSLPGCQITCAQRGAVPGQQPDQRICRHLLPPACLNRLWPTVTLAPCCPPPACSMVPEGLTQLSALTSLCLERNYIRQLPLSLSRLRSLAALRCGQSSQHTLQA